MGDRNLLKPTGTSEARSYRHHHSGPGCNYFEHDRTLETAHSDLQFSLCPSPSNSTSKPTSPPLGRINAGDSRQTDVQSCSINAHCQKTASHTDSGFSSWIGAGENSRLRTSPRARQLGSASRTSPSLTSLIEDPGDVSNGLQATGNLSRNCSVGQPFFSYLADVMPATEVVNTELSDRMFVRNPEDLCVQLSTGDTESLSLNRTDTHQSSLCWTLCCEPNVTDSTSVDFRPIQDPRKSPLIEDVCSTPDAHDSQPTVSTPQECLIFAPDPAPIVPGIVQNHPTVIDTGSSGNGAVALDTWSTSGTHRPTCYFHPQTPVSTSIEASSSDEDVDRSIPFSFHDDGDDEDEASTMSVTATAAIAFPERQSLANRRRKKRRGHCRCGTESLDDGWRSRGGRRIACPHLELGLRVSRGISDTDHQPQIVAQSAFSNTTQTSRFRPLALPMPDLGPRHVGPPSSTSAYRVHRLANTTGRRAPPTSELLGPVDCGELPCWALPAVQGTRCASVPLGAAEAVPISPLLGVTTTMLRLHQQRPPHHGGGGSSSRPEVPTTASGNSCARQALVHRYRARLHSASVCTQQHRLSLLARRIADVGDELADAPCRSARHSLPNDRSLFGGASWDSGSVWRISSLASLVTAPLDYMHHLVRMAASSLSGNSPAGILSPLAPSSTLRAEARPENPPSSASSTRGGRVGSNAQARQGSGRPGGAPFRVVGGSQHRLSGGDQQAAGTRSGSPENIFTFE